MKDKLISLRMSTDLLERIDASIALANAKSRSDYVNKAVQFYNVYLQLNGEADVFADIVGSTVESKINESVFKSESQRQKDVEQLARNQFKIATELAKISLIIGDNLNVPHDRMTDWHLQAIEEVRTLNGILGFQDRLE